MVAVVVLVLRIEVDLDEHGEVLAACRMDALDDLAHDAKAPLYAPAVVIRALVERRIEEAREQVGVRGMELDAVDAGALEPHRGGDELLLDGMDLLDRERAGMAPLLERTRDDVREVVLIDGARPRMGDLRDERSTCRMGDGSCARKLRGERIVVDVDLVAIRTPARVDAAVSRDEGADAAARERLIHRILRLRHPARVIRQEAVDRRADDAVLEREMPQVHRGFDDAHGCFLSSFSSPAVSAIHRAAPAVST